MNSTPEDFRLETKRPEGIRAAMAEQPVIYLPLGALEWHGEHLPIGLDAFTSHGLCLRAAQRTGGLVMPASYFGMTASIAGHPWTILIEDDEAFLHPLRITLKRLGDFGVKLAVIFTGHFALRQLEALSALREKAEDSWPRLLTLSISELPGSALKPDHGGLFETSVLSVLRPDLVAIERLPLADGEPEADPYGPQRREISHPLFGILGADPRALHPAQAETLTTSLLDWIVESVRQALTPTPSLS